MRVRYRICSNVARLATLAMMSGGISAGAALATEAADAESSERHIIIVNGERLTDYRVDAQDTAYRLPMSIKETPQAISVVTRTQIEDFQLDTINTLLAYTTGVNVDIAETDRTYYTARGFDIVNFQFDGVGQPLSYGLQTGAIDTATFERVEIVRGATGLLSQTGNPSATVNFVRKRPGREFAGYLSASYGSYDHVRTDVDLNLPLSSDGAVRSRFVAAYDAGESYLDRYESKKITLYGVVAADLGPNTTATAGYSWQKTDPKALLWGSLPLFYTDGTPTDFDRSTSTSQPWSRWEVIDRSILGDIAHDFGGGWTMKFSALRRAQDQDSRLFYIYGTPDRDTEEGLFSFPGAFRGPDRELTFDASVSGPLNFAGREHQIVIGANYGKKQVKQYSSYDFSAIGVALPGDTAFSGTFLLPDFPEHSLSANYTVKRKSVYGLARLSLADPLKLMIGGNVTEAESEGESYGTPFEYSADKVLPFAGLTLDLNQNVTAYASYATIFNPQVEIGADFTPLPPIEGKTYELGVKGEWNQGKFMAGIALFKTRQDNTAESVGFDTDIGQTIYAPADARSQGVEIDVAGEVLPGLQLAGGYAYTDIEDDEGEEARTFIPRHTARLSATYSPPALDRLKLGAAIRYQSRIYREQGTVASTGATIISEQDAFVLVDLMARYHLISGLSLSANINNLTNAKYLSSLRWDQSFYGAPRTYSVTLGYSF
jgi:outer membrane receptor for ferric coprogen and ferric-rhodotorulic acid